MQSSWDRKLQIPYRETKIERMVKTLKKLNYDEFYKINEVVAKTSPMMTHYHSANPLERWLWKQKKKTIKDMIDNLPIKNIVDLGCGDAGMLEVIPPSVDYLGLDISPTQIEYAKKAIKNSGRKNAKILKADVVDTNLKSESYDCALLCDVVEHVINPEKLFEETKRIIKKDGFIILSVPNEFLWEVMRASLLRFPLRSPDHINAVFPKDIKEHFLIEKEVHIPISLASQLSLIHVYLIKNAA